MNTAPADNNTGLTIALVVVLALAGTYLLLYFAIIPWPHWLPSVGFSRCSGPCRQSGAHGTDCKGFASELEKHNKGDSCKGLVDKFTRCKNCAKCDAPESFFSTCQ
jgi:hypothetical protein